VHKTPRWDRGSAKRLARIRLRGNWPNLWALLASALVILLLWFIHAWLHATGALVD